MPTLLWGEVYGQDVPHYIDWNDCCGHHHLVIHTKSWNKSRVRVSGIHSTQHASHTAPLIHPFRLCPSIRDCAFRLPVDRLVSRWFFHPLHQWVLRQFWVHRSVGGQNSQNPVHRCDPRSSRLSQWFFFWLGGFNHFSLPCFFHSIATVHICTSPVLHSSSLPQLYRIVFRSLLASFTGHCHLTLPQPQYPIEG